MLVFAQIFDVTLIFNKSINGSLIDVWTVLDLENNS